MKTTPELCFIGIGSNLDNPVVHANKAVTELAEIPQSTALRQSSLYQTDPVGPGQQGDYINAVIMLESKLTPIALLDQLQTIERRHGRERRERWAPRTLDLDILLFGNHRIDNQRLTVPHREIFQRNFVLIPFAELVDEWTFPDGSNLQQRLQECPRNGIVKLQ